MQLRYLKTTEKRGVEIYTVLAMERAMEKAGLSSVLNVHNSASLFTAKALSRLRLLRNMARVSSGPLFVCMMGLTESKTLPLGCWTEMVPYCFDCWPNTYDLWMSYFQRYRIRTGFFTARQSAQHFAAALPDMLAVWLPEAVDPSEYDPSRPLSERDIDVLELGRKHNDFHAKITEPLQSAGRTHLYERVQGSIIFPTKDDFVSGMGRTKISICFPSSLTHPERSGAVETVTLRYFESMASKCILLGHAPAELIDLFGYNPVIESEPGKELEQIQSLLADASASQALVERNYLRLLEVGTWDRRVGTLLDMLAKRAS